MGMIHLTPKELAERLRLSAQTLAGWRVTGKGPRFISHGNRVLYPLAEVEKWERDQLRSATNVPAT